MESGTGNLGETPLETLKIPTTNEQILDPGNGDSSSLDGDVAGNLSSIREIPNLDQDHSQGEVVTERVNAGINTEQPPFSASTNEQLEEESSLSESDGNENIANSDIGGEGASDASMKPKKQRRRRSWLSRKFRDWMMDQSFLQKLSRLSLVLLILTQILSTVTFSVTTALTYEGEEAFKHLSADMFPIIVQLNTIAWRVWKENEVVARAIVARTKNLEHRCSLKLDDDTSIFLADMWMHREYLAFEISEKNIFETEEEMQTLLNSFSSLNNTLTKIVDFLEVTDTNAALLSSGSDNVLVNTTLAGNYTLLDWHLIDDYLEAARTILEQVTKRTSEVEAEFLKICKKEIDFGAVDINLNLVVMLVVIICKIFETAASYLSNAYQKDRIRRETKKQLLSSAARAIQIAEKGSSSVSQAPTSLAAGSSEASLHPHLEEKHRFWTLATATLLASCLESSATFVITGISLEKVTNVVDVEFPLYTYATKIRYYDPILTGSASLWVLSDGTRPQYVDQYNAFVDPLTYVIDQSRKLATTPKDLRLYSLLDQVNTNLVDLETIALNNATAGRDSLFGKAYIQNKGVYLAAVDEYLNTQYSRIYLAINSAKDINGSLFLFSLFLMGMGLLFFVLDVSPSIFKFFGKRRRRRRFQGNSFASSSQGSSIHSPASSRPASRPTSGYYGSSPKQVGFSKDTKPITPNVKSSHQL